MLPSCLLDPIEHRSSYHQLWYFVPSLRFYLLVAQTLLCGLRCVSFLNALYFEGFPRVSSWSSVILRASPRFLSRLASHRLAGHPTPSRYRSRLLPPTYIENLGVLLRLESLAHLETLFLVHPQCLPLGWYTLSARY